MTTLTDLSRRIERLEQRQRQRKGTALPLPSPARLRTVLAMMIEAGALVNPRQDSPLWRLKAALGLEDNDSNATPGTGDSTGPKFDAVARMGA